MHAEAFLCQHLNILASDLQSVDHSRTYEKISYIQSISYNLCRKIDKAKLKALIDHELRVILY
jgi:hypothetical protein